ncbi:MAG: PBP1A family penicillin-binding protein [Eubacterium sp.]|nr:PBP1A family penicillin-binding protein [Eubacterium sp.]MCI8918298.1 PBP1A family penicillin-binding protein [Eubacterium sp.]
MAKQKKKKKYRGFWIFFKLQLLLLLLIVGAAAYYFGGGYAQTVAELKEEADSLVAKSSKELFRKGETGLVYDQKGKLLKAYKGEKDSYYLEFDQIPEIVVKTYIAVEDRQFEKHDGVDYRAILRAVIAMIRNGEVTQGGSTITQQLARTVFLNTEKTWQRKMEEIFIARNLEDKYTKSQIMEFYLNNIYFGHGYYGIQAAAQGYFSKNIDELDLSQTVFLCAIPNNPSLYDPVNNKKNTISRRNRMLSAMYDQGYISRAAAAEAKKEKIKLKRSKSIKKIDYVETYVNYCAVRALMKAQGFEFQHYFENEKQERQYDKAYRKLYIECESSLYTSGYRIYTSIDMKQQEKLQEAIDAGLGGFEDVSEEGVYKLQGAGVTIDNMTGWVTAIVGGRTQEFEGYTLNRAYQSFRQPGSAIKPLLVYAPVLERGYTPDTIVVDEPVQDGPANADGIYEGGITLRHAVKKSKNTIAWKLFDELTPLAGLGYLKAMNFTKIDTEDERLPTALGGFTTGVSPLEMAAGYATLQNDGCYREPTCIVKIEDSQDNLIYSSESESDKNKKKSKEQQAEGTRIYKSNAARTMTDMLQTVMTEGTARGLGLGEMPCAGKTGTTNDNKDGWFVGYTRYYTTGIWVGYDMPVSMPGLTGASYPGHIWHNYMLSIHEGMTPVSFIPYIEQKEIEDDFAE